MIYDKSFIPSFCKENILLDNAVWLIQYDLNGIKAQWIQHAICVDLIDEKTSFIIW